MVTAPVRAADVRDEQPLPTPLAWLHTPLAERVALIRRGVPARWLLDTEAAMGFTRRALCDLLGIKVSTANRKLHNNALLSHDESERLMGLHRLLGELQALLRDCGDGTPFDAAAWLASWLQRPNQALGGETPAAFMDTAEGREQVGRLIGAQRSGAYM